MIYSVAYEKQVHAYSWGSRSVKYKISYGLKKVKNWWKQVWHWTKMAAMTHVCNKIANISINTNFKTELLLLLPHVCHELAFHCNRIYYFDFSAFEFAFFPFLLFLQLFFFNTPCFVDGTSCIYILLLITRKMIYHVIIFFFSTKGWVTA